MQEIAAPPRLSAADAVARYDGAMLQKIAISEFRSCRNVELDLSRPLVALVGKNGVGKTNLLHAIRLAAGLCSGTSSWSELESNLGTTKATLTLDFRVDGREYVYSCSRCREAVGQSPQIEEILLERGTGPILVRSDDKIQTRLHESGIEIGRQTSGLKALMQLLPDSKVAHVLTPIWQFTQAVRYYRLIDRVRDHEPMPHFVAERTYHQWIETFPQVDSNWDSVALRLIHMHEAQPDRFEELLQLLGPDGLGLLETILVVRIDTSTPNGSARPAHGGAGFVLGFVPGSGMAGAMQVFNYSGLSAGTRRVIQLLVYMIFDESSVMLLEQPEDSIHAGLLSKVIDTLTVYSDRCQLVMTTHSPEVLDLLEPESVRVVTAKAAGTEVSMLSKTQLNDFEAYFQDRGTLAEYLRTL